MSLKTTNAITGSGNRAWDGNGPQPPTSFAGSGNRACNGNGPQPPTLLTALATRHAMAMVHSHQRYRWPWQQGMRWQWSTTTNAVDGPGNKARDGNGPQSPIRSGSVLHRSPQPPKLALALSTRQATAMVSCPGQTSSMANSPSSSDGKIIRTTQCRRSDFPQSSSLSKPKGTVQFCSWPIFQNNVSS